MPQIIHNPPPKTWDWILMAKALLVMLSTRDWNWIGWRGGITKMFNNDSGGSYFTRQVGTRDTNWSGWWWYNHVVEHSLGGTDDLLQWMDSSGTVTRTNEYPLNGGQTGMMIMMIIIWWSPLDWKKDRIPSGTSVGLEWYGWWSIKELQE